MSEALLLKENKNLPEGAESEIKDSDLDAVVVSDSELLKIKHARRLKEIQKQIDAGEYNVSAEDITESILNQD